MSLYEPAAAFEESVTLTPRMSLLLDVDEKPVEYELVLFRSDKAD
jgi:hypothetical protein